MSNEQVTLNMPGHPANGLRVEVVGDGEDNAIQVRLLSSNGGAYHIGDLLEVERYELRKTA